MRSLWAVTAAAALLGALHVSTQSAPPTILPGREQRVGQQSYGPYLAEILKAEGLNTFSIAQLSTVTSTTPNRAQVVVLAETTLQPVGCHPIQQLRGRRRGRPDCDAARRPAAVRHSGLSIEPSSSNQGYFAINPGKQLRRWIPDHVAALSRPSAALYSRQVALEVLATLYSIRKQQPLPSPAVVRYLNTVTWTYDLAKPPSCTRQGNPANASDRDGKRRTGTSPTPSSTTRSIAIRRRSHGADVQMRMLAQARSRDCALLGTMPLLSRLCTSRNQQDPSLF